VDVVEFLFVEPVVFGVVYLETAVARDTILFLSNISQRGREVRNWTTNKTGWMGLKSVPKTFASGNSSANSIAQIPVPVPKSSTFFGFLSGAR
jgi:hypothetical protein